MDLKKKKRFKRGERKALMVELDKTASLIRELDSKCKKSSALKREIWKLKNQAVQMGLMLGFSFGKSVRIAGAEMNGYWHVRYDVGKLDYKRLVEF